MRIAALIIGIFGSIAGFIGALVALLFGGIGTAFGAEGSGTIVGLGIGALAMSVAGLVGAALALAKPKLSAVIMILSAASGLVFISFAYVLGAILLLIAALLAFLGRNQS